MARLRVFRWAQRKKSLAEVRAFWTVAGSLFALSVLSWLLHLLLGRVVRTAEGESWAQLVGVFTLIVGFVLLAVSHLRQPGIDPRVALGWVNDVQPTQNSAADTAPKESAEMAALPTPVELDWENLLEPAGGSTRLGDAINSVIVREPWGGLSPESASLPMAIAIEDSSSRQRLRLPLTQRFRFTRLAWDLNYRRRTFGLLIWKRRPESIRAMSSR